MIVTIPGWGGGAGKPFVKRVVAIAGDKVGCCSNGRVTLNEAPLAEPYLAPGTEEASFGPLVVPTGQLWLMGDNRPMSADSRYHGTVPANGVIGVVVLK